MNDYQRERNMAAAWLAADPANRMLRITESPPLKFQFYVLLPGHWEPMTVTLFAYDRMPDTAPRLHRHLLELIEALQRRQASNYHDDAERLAALSADATATAKRCEKAERAAQQAIKEWKP